MSDITVLVVDDEVRMRKLIKDFLMQKGYAILEAGDGEEALSVFEENSNKIKLILLDVMMPKLDGWSVLRQIRQTSKVPIIMLTARGEEQDELFGFELGVDEYISKPFSPKILVARVEAILKRTSPELKELKDYGSTLFKDKFANLCGLDSLLKIENNMDKIMETEEKAIKLNNKLMSDKCEGMKAQKVAKKIEDCKARINALYFETQKLIFTSYFNTQFNKILTTADIDEYRLRLYNYKNYIGISEDYSDFNEFYINKMMDLDNKYESIVNNTSLTVVSDSKISKFFRKIKAILSATIELSK